MARTRIWLAAMALAISFPVTAQTAKPEAKPESKSESKPEAKPEAKAEPQPERKPVARKANPKRSEDARHCLDKASNTDIIKCAEEYL